MDMRRVILLALAAIFLGGCVVHEHHPRPREVIVVVPEHHR